MTAYDKEQNREAVETYVVSYSLIQELNMKERIFIGTTLSG